MDRNLLWPWPGCFQAAGWELSEVAEEMKPLWHCRHKSMLLWHAVKRPRELVVTKLVTPAGFPCVAMSHGITSAPQPELPGGAPGSGQHSYISLCGDEFGGNCGFQANTRWTCSHFTVKWDFVGIDWKVLQNSQRSTLCCWGWLFF